MKTKFTGGVKVVLKAGLRKVNEILKTLRFIYCKNEYNINFKT